MSDGLACDRCGKSLLVDELIRYVVEMKVYAAYDVLEVTKEDLARDRREELERISRELERRDPAEVQDEVARVLRFDLCPPCQRRFLGDPLGKGPRP